MPARDMIRLEVPMRCGESYNGFDNDTLAVHFVRHHPGIATVTGSLRMISRTYWTMYSGTIQTGAQKYQARSTTLWYGQQGTTLPIPIFSFFLYIYTLCVFLFHCKYFPRDFPDRVRR